MKTITSLLIASGALTTCLARPLQERAIAPWSRQTFKIEDLTLRKSFWNREQVSFNILHASGDPSPSTCVPWDFTTSSPTLYFDQNAWYQCGEDSPFSFNLKDGVLTLMETDNEHGTTLKGENNVGEPPCRAGGDGPEDFVCQFGEGTGPVYIELLEQVHS